MMFLTTSSPRSDHKAISIIVAKERKANFSSVNANIGILYFFYKVFPCTAIPKRGDHKQGVEQNRD